MKQFNLCAGTVIDKNWIVTSATCCKRDDIVTITFNDYSIFYADQNQHKITSTLFHVHQDLDACLIRTTDMSDIVTHIPCLKKVSTKLLLKNSRETNLRLGLDDPLICFGFQGYHLFMGHGLKS